MCAAVTLVALAAAVTGTRGGGVTAGGAASFQSANPPPKPVYILAKPENFNIDNFPGLMDGVKQKLIRDHGIESRRVEIKKFLDPDAPNRCAGIAGPCDTVKLIEMPGCKEDRCELRVVINCSAFNWQNLKAVSSRRNLDTVVALAIRNHEEITGEAHEQRR